MGLARGDGAAPPPGFLVVSTLMINAYKRLGRGTDLIPSWTGDAFYLTAILFVDDSDLLHLAELSETEDDFFEHVQEATFDWGRLVQATGVLVCVIPVWNSRNSLRFRPKKAEKRHNPGINPENPVFRRFPGIRSVFG